MEAKLKMKVERIYSGEITIDKILKELLNTQIDNLIKIQSNNNDANHDFVKGSEKS